VLEYRFEGSAADGSGGQHDGKIHGNPRFVAGKVGRCVALDGQQDYVDCGDALANLGQTFTAECWVNPADSQRTHVDLFGNHYHGGLGFTIEQDGGNTNCFAAVYGAGSDRWVSARPIRLAAGKWQHIAVVKTPSEFRELNDPYLYRVTARVWVEKSESFDERSVRCGFRDFRFENGYFRLNGRRILPRGPVLPAHYPIGFSVPSDSDYFRREVVAMKMMGMNICRLIFGGTTARQPDVFDELGVMVYQASYGEGGIGFDGVNFSPEFPKRDEGFDRAVARIVRRDRNHPSVVCWGLTNERENDSHFRHVAEKTLPMVRFLDDSRMVMLNSGRFDNDWRLGSLCNPGSWRWESPLHDRHWYPDVPHSAEVIRALRNLGTKDAPVLLSEYGIANAVDLPRYARHFEQRGAEDAEDARYFRDMLSQFMTDWKRWRLADCWARPEPPLALPVFSEAVTMDGPSGRYRFLVTFERGAAAAGGEVELFVTDPAGMPAVRNEVVLWGEDPDLAKWLAEHDVGVKAFAQAAAASREIILVGLKPPSGDAANEFAKLARRIARGSTTIFLCPAVLANGDQPTAWLPLTRKGALTRLNECGGYYRADAFAKRHAFFDGLPCGGILDYTFYREIIPQVAWCGLDDPAEVVAGIIRAQMGYASGLLVSVHRLEAGRLVLTTLLIRENLGRDPGAERLLRNMLDYASRDVDQPPADLPEDFDRQLQAMGYAR